MTKQRWYSLLLTLIVVGSLLFSGPAKAVTLNIEFASETVDSSSDVTFQVAVDLSGGERIPVQNLTLYLTATSGDSTAPNRTCSFAPNGDNLTSCSDVTITLNNKRGYASSLQYGYGYGMYLNGSYALTNSTFGTGYGYGYAEGYESVAYPYGELSYNVTWTTPSVSQDTNYNIRLVAIVSPATDNKVTYQTTQDTVVKVNYADDNPTVTVTTPVNGSTYTNPVNLTWSASATVGSIAYQWYLLDGNGAKNLLSSSPTQVNFTAGQHTLSMGVNDTYGNSASSGTYTFYVNQPINVTQIQSIVLANEPALTDWTLLDSSSTDQTSNGSLNINQTLTLQVGFNTTDFEGTVEIPEFNGLDANWNNPFNMDVSITSQSANTTKQFSGSSLLTISLLKNMSNWLPNSAYALGAKIVLMRGLPPNIEVLYIADDDGREVFEVTSLCSAPAGPGVAITTSNMCYFNTTTNITVWIPHLSGVALGNDTAAPSINISSPTNGSTVNNSLFTFSFDVWESNPDSSFCNYSIVNGGTTLAEDTLTTSDMTQSGTKYSFSTSVTGASDAPYNATVSCDDENNRSSTVMHSFTVADTTVPTISSTSEDQSGTTSVTVTLSATTNEAASCAYSTSDVAYGSMTAMVGSGTSHTADVTITESVSDTVYYFRCEDTAGNTMLSSSSITFDVTVSATATRSTGGSSGSGTASQDEYYIFYSVIGPDAEYRARVNKDNVAVQTVRFELSERADDVEMLVSRVYTLPGEVLDFSGSVYQYLDMRLLGVDDKFKSASARFYVSLTWLEEQGIEKEDIALYRYVDGAWVQQKTEYALSDSYSAYYDAELEGFSYFAVGEKTEQPESSLPTGQVISEPIEAEEQSETVEVVTEPTTSEPPMKKDEMKSGSRGSLGVVVFLILLVVAVAVVILLLMNKGRGGSLDRLEKKLKKLQNAK